MKTKRVALAASLLALASVAKAGTVKIDAVAIAGVVNSTVPQCTPPDQAAGVRFYSADGIPTIDAAGNVVFTGSLYGTGISSANRYGIWSGSPGNLKEIGQSGDPAPSTPSGIAWEGAFSTYNGASGNSLVTVRGSVQGTGVDSTNSEGFWVGTPGQLKLVARTGNLAPDTNATTTFNRLGTSVVSSGSGIIAATLGGTGVTTSNDTGIWTWDSSGTLTKIAREGDSANGLGTGVVFGSFASASTPPFAMNASGQIVMAANVGGIAKRSLYDQAMWFGTANSIAPIARWGDVAPDVGGAVWTTRLQDTPSINNAGEIAFTGAVRNVSTNITSYGVWAGLPGDLHRVVASGDVAQGTGGLTFSSFSNAMLTGTDLLTFKGSLAGAATSRDEGIWFGSDGSYSLLVHEGMQAPGLDPGLTIRSFYMPEFNSLGEAVFKAQLAGSGVNDANDYILYGYVPGEGLLKLAREGEDLFASGVKWHVANINTVSEYGVWSGGQDGRTSWFNDAGQFAFEATLVSDSGQWSGGGIFRGQLSASAVPLPAAAWGGMLLISGLGLVRAWRKRAI